MALFEVTDYDKKVYEEELKDFLPDEMIDIHTHIWLNELRNRKLREGEVKRSVSWPSLVAAENPVEDLQETYRLMFPDKKVSALMFTSGNTIELPNLNPYVIEASKKSGWPSLYYSTPEESAEEVEKKIREGGFLGLKSYLGLSPVYIPEKEIRIFDFFPHHQLKKLDEMKAIMMLHIPRDGRLKDPVNIAQIKEIKEKYPNIRLIIAHIGRAYTPSDIGDAFEQLADCKDLMFDFCANCCEEAMYELLKAVGPKRVMFGSDMPILRMRTHRIVEGSNYVNLVPKGLYGDVSGDRHMREVEGEEAEKITFFMYEEILAFKRAAERLGLSKEDVRCAFYQNARDYIDGARKDIYGV